MPGLSGPSILRPRGTVKAIAKAADRLLLRYSWRRASMGWRRAACIAG